MNEFQRSNSKTTDVSTFSPVKNENLDALSEIKVEGNSQNSQFYGIAEIAIQTNDLFSSNVPSILGKSKFLLLIIWIGSKCERLKRNTEKKGKKLLKPNVEDLNINKMLKKDSNGVDT